MLILITLGDRDGETQWAGRVSRCVGRDNLPAIFMEVNSCGSKWK